MHDTDYLLSYGKALVSLTATLRTADAQKDGTLATVILMSMYEVSLPYSASMLGIIQLRNNQMISGEKPQDKVWDSHSGGREFLLRLRGLQQFESERGKSLFRNSYTQMVSSKTTHFYVWFNITDRNGLDSQCQRFRNVANFRMNRTIG